MRHKTWVTAVMAAGLLALTLTGCSGGNSGSDDVDETPAPAQAEDPARPYPEVTVTAAEPGTLKAALLTVEDITVEGFVDDWYTDNETGGVCALDFSDVMPPKMLGTEVSVGFSSSSLMTLLSESAWSGPEAEDVVASIAEELAACSGEYSGVWSDSSVVVTTEAVEMDVPGAAASVCRSYEMMTADGGLDTYGLMCVASSGDRVVALLCILLKDTPGLAPEDYQDLLAVAAAKAFAR